MKKCGEYYSTGGVPQVEVVWSGLMPDQRRQILRYCLLGPKHEQSLLVGPQHWESLPRKLYQVLFRNFKDLLTLVPTEQTARIVALLQA